MSADDQVVSADDEAEADARRQPEDFDARVASIAILAEPVRRSLYRFVIGKSEPVSREEAAIGTDVARHTAKFHLDKLVDDGLLDAEFRRPPGRGGPGAGRPSKLYRRSMREVSVSVPERRYELAGRLLAQAVTDAAREGVPVSEALKRTVVEEGRLLGRSVVKKARSQGRSAIREATIRILEDFGYEPSIDSNGVTLINCPFHSLADEYTELVCGMNLDLIGGLLSGLDNTGLEAKLDPVPGRCCVRLQNV